ncbi:hypothetical protein [Sandaracinus amylolyticus]|uniref:hypothetical protein n=1 Tax=Sandaracinus amylolyticus TaxID=927083 RepID=UPI001F1E0018|nr:hypothetical protein [Sandaracinus amylolyticus]UJR82530.1 Hypothetical protein I5071_45950 [Sandaracinus amylolyticus]
MPTTKSIAHRARSWADALDGASLRAIRRARPALIRAARRAPHDPSAALALARLVDVEGARADVHDALARALAASDDASARARLELALAQVAFERGGVGEAEQHVAHARDAARASHDPALEARASLVDARLALLTGRASSALEDARRIVARIRPPRADLLASVDAIAAMHALREGKKLDARALFERALRAASTYRGEVEIAVLAGMLGNVEHDLGLVESAAERFALAIRLGRRVESESVVAIFEGYLGLALHELGQHDVAARHHRAAVRRCETLGLERFAAQSRALLAVLDARRPRFHARAELALADALGRIAATGDHERADALGVLSAALDAELATALAQSGARSEAVIRVVRARALLDAASACSDDARIFARLAGVSLARAVAAAAEPDAALAVEPDGSSFSVRGHRVSVARHAAVRRVLARLVLGWADERDVGDDELVAAAWPGERLVPRSATHRLHVAISTLRRAGLGEHLERAARGYRLRGPLALLAPED